jgi:hypothetical protein
MFYAVDSDGNRLFPLGGILTGEHRNNLKKLGLDHISVCSDCDEEVQSGFDPRHGDFDFCGCDLK